MWLTAYIKRDCLSPYHCTALKVKVTVPVKPSLLIVRKSAGFEGVSTEAWPC